MTSAKDLGWSLVRTIVPAAVTLAIGVVTDNFGPVVDDGTRTQLVALAYAVAYAGYYTIVRALETYVAPRFGWLLGDFRKGLTAPVYPASDVTLVVPPAPELANGATVEPTV